AVAELRNTDLLRSLGSDGAHGPRIFVANTLDNPEAGVTTLSAGTALIARSHREANDVKRNQKFTVILGNPPYAERAEGMGSWIEQGDRSGNVPAPLNAFRGDGTARYEHNLKNLYVYFWRWAALKAFDDLPDDGGVVCFITTSGYLRGPG